MLRLSFSSVGKMGETGERMKKEMWFQKTAFPDFRH